MTPEASKRFTQLRVVTARATTYFGSGGRDTERILTALQEACPDLTAKEVKHAVLACKLVETKRKEEA